MQFLALNRAYIMLRELGVLVHLCTSQRGMEYLPRRA